MTTCKHCTAYEPHSDFNGMCRLNAPTISEVLLAKELADGANWPTALDHSTVWPIVSDDDWCNKYEVDTHADNV